MPWMTITTRRPRTFVPPEAGWLAAYFRKTAEKFRGIGSDLRRVPTVLDETWDGVSRDRFMLDFEPRPGRMEAVALWLEFAARQIAATEVTVWETVEQQVWAADPVER